MTDRRRTVLDVVDGWGAEHAAAAVVGPDGAIAVHDDADRSFRWASVTKVLTGFAVLRAVEDAAVDLDEPAGPPGSTVRHLLAHASGLPFEGETVLAAPGTRRIYSNPGFDVLGALLARRLDRPFAEILDEHVLRPLGMDGTTLEDRPSQGLRGPLRDLMVVAREMLRPTLVRGVTMDLATSVVFPGLPGVVPGIGRFDDCAWGLAFEIRAGKRPHWTGSRNSPSTFGHFGGAGTFVWADPALDLALVCLTDREFDRWSLDAWPPFSDEVIEAFRG